MPSKKKVQHHWDHQKETLGAFLWFQRSCTSSHHQDIQKPYSMYRQLNDPIILYKTILRETTGFFKKKEQNHTFVNIQCYLLFPSSKHFAPSNIVTPPCACRHRYCQYHQQLPAQRVIYLLTSKRKKERHHPSPWKRTRCFQWLIMWHSLYWSE